MFKNESESLMQQLKEERREKKRLERELRERDMLLNTYESTVAFHEKLIETYKAKSAEQDLYLQMMLEHSPDIIVLIDNQQRFITGTKRALRILGINPDKLNENNFFNVISSIFPESFINHLNESFREVIEKEASLSFTENIRLEWGGDFIFNIILTPFMNNEKVMGVLLQMHDITALQKAIDEAEHANAVKSQFLAMMSHEIHTPLTVIATGIDFADEESAKKGDITEIRNALSIVRDETQRLGRMVGSMVQLASMDGNETNRKRTDFAALLKNSAEVFRLTMARRNNSLHVEIPEGLPDIFVEADRFVQVMTNLLSNAAGYTKNGQIKLMAAYDATFITVYVSDTGEGINPKILPYIFERGFSGRSGTGYGLYLCKTILEAHGGSIRVESEPDTGTTVIFTVPVYGGQQEGMGHDQ
jgi:PAS domain S-box-containing protein